MANHSLCAKTAFILNFSDFKKVIKKNAWKIILKTTFIWGDQGVEGKALVVCTMADIREHQILGLRCFCIDPKMLKLRNGNLHQNLHDVTELEGCTGGLTFNNDGSYIKSSLKLLTWLQSLNTKKDS